MIRLRFAGPSNGRLAASPVMWTGSLVSSVSSFKNCCNHDIEGRLATRQMHLDLVDTMLTLRGSPISTALWVPANPYRMSRLYTDHVRVLHSYYGVHPRLAMRESKRMQLFESLLRAAFRGVNV